jgi:hypothetical protein
MVDSAKINTADMRRYLPIPGKADSIAFNVNLTPSASVVCQTPVSMITRAVKVQTTMVSINGPSIAIKPSRIGSLFLEAPWTIGAVPIPASLEKAALLAPVMITAPTTPPAAAFPVNASEIINQSISGTSTKFFPTIIKTVQNKVPP